MMPDQPSQVTPGEIRDLLAQMRLLRPDSTFSERLAYFEAKASIFRRIAAEDDTPEAHLVAAVAGDYLSELRRQAGEAEAEGAAR